MSTNEIILLVKAVLSFTFIQTVFRLSKSSLLVVIVLNLLLVSVFGGKLISLFGFITNNGNVFYASVFFATQLVVEYYGKKEGYKSVMLGVGSILFFLLMSQLTILKIGEPQTSAIEQAIHILFTISPRVAIASLVGYLVSQMVNIHLYGLLKEKTHGKKMYLRINVANIAGQLVDSILFFTIAFFGTTTTSAIIEFAAVGYVVKVLLGALSTPFFYLGRSDSG